MDPRLPKMSKNGMGTIRPQRPSTAYRIRCVTCFLERRATSWALMMVQIYNKKTERTKLFSPWAIWRASDTPLKRDTEAKAKVVDAVQTVGQQIALIG